MFKIPNMEVKGTMEIALSQETVINHIHMIAHSLLTKYEVVRSKDLSKWARSDRVHSTRLQIN